MRPLFLCLFLLALLTFGAGKARATTYATWIMVWDGHDQTKWWKATDYAGAKVSVGGKSQSIDWADNKQVGEYLDGIKKAGVTVVIADLTNGWGWLDTRCQYIQSLCAQKGLKFCVAENSGGDASKFESHAQDIWDNFAGPSAPNSKTYFQYHGKPLVVCYGIRDWFNTYQKSTSPARSRFNLVWASGEDPDKDKWGWQLDPRVGSVPSSDSMFVTPALKWSKDDDQWRKSLAWLDYNFALAKKQNPAFVIVGAYDDIIERNSWLAADTKDCIPGRQMRDASGALSPDAYYDRVTQWIAGTPSVVPGGLLRDGVYRLVNRDSGKRLAVLGGEAGTPLSQKAPDTGTGDEFWLYHLGQNRYKVIALHSGLAVDVLGGTLQDGFPVDQSWNADVPWQRWTVEATDKGWYRLTNEETGRALAVVTGAASDRTAVIQQPKANAASQQWRFEPVLTLGDILPPGNSATPGRL